MFNNVTFQSLMFRPLWLQLVLINIWVALFLSPSLALAWLGAECFGLATAKSWNWFLIAWCCSYSPRLFHPPPHQSIQQIVQNVFFQIEKCIFHDWQSQLFNLTNNFLWLRAALIVCASSFSPTNPRIYSANSVWAKVCLILTKMLDFVKNT